MLFNTLTIYKPPIRVTSRIVKEGGELLTTLHWYRFQI